MAKVFQLVPRDTLRRLRAQLEEKPKDIDEYLLKKAESNMKRLSKKVPKKKLNIHASENVLRYRANLQQFIKQKKDIAKKPVRVVVTDRKGDAIVGETQGAPTVRKPKKRRAQNTEDTQHKFARFEDQDEPENEDAYMHFQSPLPQPDFDADISEAKPKERKDGSSGKKKQPKQSSPWERPTRSTTNATPLDQKHISKYGSKLYKHVISNKQWYGDVLVGNNQIKNDRGDGPMKNSNVKQSCERLIAGAIRKTFLVATPPGHGKFNKEVKLDQEAQAIINEATTQYGKGLKRLQQGTGRGRPKRVPDKNVKRGRPREKPKAESPFRPARWRRPKR